ncbi:hypothetical protein ACIRPQ_20165 [Streptomyces sp. NPDC101213]|uniref:hypothetical protein n=1 Tax=Streptomyces sp. NPDC101213 TaxID=3366130 RepID=UPI0037FC4BAA
MSDTNRVNDTNRVDDLLKRGTGTAHAVEEGTAAAARRALRGPRTVVRAVAAVVPGPAAATASAPERADETPPHHAVRAERQAYLPSDAGRRRTTA